MQNLHHSERILYELLREWLNQQQGGPELLAEFERNPEAAAQQLSDFLLTGNVSLPPTLATYVTGGRVEKLISIAQAGVVYVQPAEPQPTLTPKEQRDLERRYLRQVAEECRYLQTEGVDRVNAELTDVFIMLEAVESPRREKLTDIAPESGRFQEMGLKEGQGHIVSSEPPPPPVPLHKAMSEHTHLVILGEPGTGKTTTLQFVALCLAKADEGWAKEKLDLDETRVPVRIALREYDGAERLDRFIIRWLDRAYVSEVLAQTWLVEGRLAILLDGLDEVPKACRAAVIEAIDRFVATPEGRGCRVVITSRIASYREMRGLEAKLGHYTIRPFVEPQSALFYVNGWLQALNPMTADTARSEAQTLLKEMKEQGGLRRMTSNPLLLRLTVAVYVETGKLAHNRAELYRRYVGEVIWKQAESWERPRWDRRQIEQVLEKIAWTLQVQGAQTSNTLAEKVETVMTDVADCWMLLDYLREQLGLLAIYGYERGDLIAFRHLTFQEYYVARRLKESWDRNRLRTWRFLHPRLHHPAWREPILLLAGMLDETETTELVHRILKAHSLYERELHRDLLLAAAAIGDGASVADRLADNVASKLVHLYLDINVKLPHLLAVPVGIWLLFGVALYYYGPAPGCLIPIGTLIWYGLWFWWQGRWHHALTLPELRISPRLHAILTFPERLSGRCAFEVLRDQVRDSLARLPRPQQAQIIEPLTRALRSIYPGVPRSAAEALGKIGDPRAVEPLTRVLRDTSPDARRRAADKITRRSAAEALGEIGAPHAVEPLIGVLGDEDVHETAASVLVKIGEPAVEPLIRALGVRDTQVRSGAAQVLEEIGQPAVEPLVRALENQNDEVRKRVVETLGKIKDPRAEEPLGRVGLRDNNEQVRIAAINAQADMGIPAIAEPFARSLIRLLDEAEKEVRKRVVERLGTLDNYYAVEPLTRALRDEIPEIRRNAAELLGKIGDPRAVEALIGALRDETPEIRRSAAESLGKIGDPRAVEPLIRVLKDEDKDVRRNTEDALVKIGEPAVEPLIQALGDQDKQVRTAAANVLFQIGDSRAVEPLMAFLRDENGDVRMLTADAVERLFTPAAIELLIAALQDKVDRVRQLATYALGKIGDPRAVEPLIAILRDENSGSHLRSKAAEALRHIGDHRAVEPLIAALEDKNSSIRRSSAYALGKFADPRALEPLGRALKDSEDIHIADHAAIALAKLDDPRAAELLIQALEDKEWQVRRMAQTMLLKIGDPRVVEPSIRALEHKEDRFTRIRAAEMLGSMSEQLDEWMAGRVARRLWWRLTDFRGYAGVADAAYDALNKVVARLTELKVAQLGAGPPLFADVPSKDLK